MFARLRNLDNDAKQIVFVIGASRLSSLLGGFAR